jgi:hypothetical protein
MTQYLDKSFSVALGNDNFRSGWDAIFGKKGDTKRPTPDFLELVKSRLSTGDKVRLSGAPCEVRGRDSFPNGEAYREYLIDLAKDLILVAQSSFEDETR